MPDEGDWKRLADFVIAWRTKPEVNLQREDLARLMGTNAKTVARIEQGTSVSKTTLGKLDLAVGWAAGTARSIVYDGGEPRMVDISAEVSALLQPLVERSQEIQRKMDLVPAVYDDYGPAAAREAIATLSAEFSALQEEIASLLRGKSTRHVS